VPADVVGQHAQEYVGAHPVADGPHIEFGFTLHTVVGFTHRSLRAQVSAQLDIPYTRNQMSYDLARLRRNRIIQRLPHTNTYVLTATGSAWPSSAPKSRNGCCGHCWPPTSHRHHEHSVKPCAPPIP
jgi:hypothetical protein